MWKATVPTIAGTSLHGSILKDIGIEMDSAKYIIHPIHEPDAIGIFKEPRFLMESIGLPIPLTNARVSAFSSLRTYSPPVVCLAFGIVEQPLIRTFSNPGG